MKRIAWTSFLLLTVGLLTFGAFEEARAQTCCGLSTSAAESLREMCQDGSCESPITPGTSTVTGCQNRVLFGDSTELLQCDAGLTYTGALLESSDQTNISGPDATTNVEIGSTANDANAGTGGTSVVIGNGATNTINGTGVVAIGSLAAVTTASGVDSIAIGRAATVTSANGMTIGAGATAGNGSIRIGNGGSAATNSIAIGLSASSSAGEFVAGSSAPVISNVYFGKGAASTSATAYAVNGTGGSGANNAGADLQLDGGASTGTAAGGDVVQRATPSGASSSTPNVEEERHRIHAQGFTLADNTATTFATMTLGNDTGGGGTISYCVITRDATTSSNECGEVDYGGVDVTAGAGGETCPTPTKQGTPIQILAGATLTVTFAATTGTDLCNLRVTADTNIAVPTALYITWNASNPGGRTLVPVLNP